jgi:phosphatidylglycerophosphate synthase
MNRTPSRPRFSPPFEPVGPVADCYSAGEREWMIATQRWRARLLDRWLIVLTRLKVSPDAITGLSFVAGIAFGPIWFLSQPAALVLLALHVLLDGIDGPLARFQGVASRRGSFTDTMSDQAVVTAVALTLMIDGVVGALPGGLYIFLYALVAMFAMVRNALAAPYSWLVRPRFFVYAWIVVELFVWPGTLTGLLWVCNGLLAIKVATGFLRIRKRL